MTDKFVGKLIQQHVDVVETLLILIPMTYTNVRSATW
jgi:hypothetical protein